MALRGLWGSFFSRVEKGTAMVKPFRRGFFSPVGLNVAPAVPAAEVFSNVRYKFKDLDDRLASMERVVTSEEWRLKRQFRDLEGS